VIPKGGFDEIKARGLQQFKMKLSASLDFCTTGVRTRRLVKNQIAYGSNQSSARLVP
jgi:hypothetical protein